MKTLEIIHVGLTVSNINRSIEFYRDILGLDYKGQILMEGPETDTLFGRKNCKVKVAYLNGGNNIYSPPIELLEFVSEDIKRANSNLFQTSISEICFRVDNIDEYYRHLSDNLVECLSEPQEFDFSSKGFGKSKALYFKDPDGIILEAIQVLI